MAKPVVGQGWRCPAPVGSVALSVAAKAVDPDAIVWTGDAELNLEDQDVVNFGIPVGYEDFVRNHLAKKSVKHDELVEKITRPGSPERVL